MMLANIDPSWEPILEEEFKKPYFKKLRNFVIEERLQAPVYPPKELVFNALSLTPFDKVKVVIVGQDPYHGPGQAHGLSFSVPKGVPLPPSLKNIYKELESDLGLAPSSNGCLTSWAEQGVLLLNATLTVRESTPFSHHGQGWELFTDALLLALAKRPQPLVFVLWGKSAQEKGAIVPRGTKHLVLTAPHPSPFSCHKGFFGCKHFSTINQFLAKNDQPIINWKLI